MADLKEILSGNHESVSDEELLKYLYDSISPEERDAIEKRLSNGPFESDAIDGLQQVKDQERLTKHLTQLNHKLQQQLFSKKHKIQKREVKDLQWIILAIIILLAICFVGYLIISLH